MASGVNFLSSLPIVHPVLSLFLLILVPGLTLLFLAVVIVHRQDQVARSEVILPSDAADNGERPTVAMEINNSPWLTSFLECASPSTTVSVLHRIIDTTHRFSGWICLITLLTSIMTLLFQVGYSYKYLQLYTSDVKYYMKVNIPAFDNIQVINSAKSTSSFSAFAASHGIIHRRRHEMDLANLGSSETVSVIYHTSNWDNVLTQTVLQNICQTERNIIRQLQCLDTTNYKSGVALSMYTASCTFQTSFQSSLHVYGFAQNAYFVQDGTSSTNPQSAILLSYFKLGTCFKEYGASGLNAKLRSFSVGGIISTFVSNSYVISEFEEDIFNAAYLSVIAIVACTGFIILTLRGVITAMLTMYVIIFSLVNAVAFLPLWGYGTLSAFNLMGIFILIGVGANLIMFFDYAWRKRLSRGAQASVDDIIEIYADVGLPILFTILAAIISLFSKLISPVIVISQLGAFLGVAVIVLYLSFHLIIIPAYIFTAKFPLPDAFHSKVKYYEELYKVQKAYLLVAVTNWTTRIPKQTAPDEPDAEAAAIDENSMNVSSRSFFDIVVLNMSHLMLPTRSSEESTGNDFKRSRTNVCTKSMGFLMFCLSCVSVYLAIYFSGQVYQVNYGIPQLFLPDSNLGQAFYILQKYSANIFSTSASSLGTAGGPVAYSAAPTTVGAPSANPVSRAPSSIPLSQAPVSRLPTSSPTDSPTFRVTTVSPSRAPSILPSSSSMPSLQISSGSPVIAPSWAPFTAIPPSFAPSAASSSQPSVDTSAPSLLPFVTVNLPTVTPNTSPFSVSDSYVEYLVACCWGLYSSKPHIDSDAVPSYSVATFQSYEDNGLLADMNSICTYVDHNRVMLNIHPFWNRSVDCIYDQVYPELSGLPAGSTSMKLALLSWASKSTVASGLLGIDGQDAVLSAISTVWVCSNFSIRSNIPSLVADPAFTVDIQQKWEAAFSAHATQYANKFGVPIVVGSQDFTYPILALEVVNSVELAVIISVVGFIFLLFIFTLCDLSVSLLGTLSLINILIVTICLHLYFCTALVDLLDIVVLVAIVSMMVDFPAHAILYFMSHREIGDKAKWLESPAESTFRYMVFFLLAPLILFVLTGIPLLFATLQLLRKTGEYIIILALVSFTITAGVIPFLLGLSCVQPSLLSLKSRFTRMGAREQKTAVEQVLVLNAT